MARRGNKNSRVFKGIITMLVESAALYAINGIIVIIFYVKKDPLFDVFLHVQAQLMVCSRISSIQPETCIADVQPQCISPLLILIRVAQGRAYAQNQHVDSSMELPADWPVLNADQRSVESATLPVFKRPTVPSSRRHIETMLSMERIGGEDAFEAVNPTQAKVES